MKCRDIVYRTYCLLSLNSNGSMNDVRKLCHEIVSWPWVVGQIPISWQPSLDQWDLHHARYLDNKVTYPGNNS